MRIVRFTPNESVGIGTDPHFGVINEKDQILVLKGDPLFSGIIPTETKVDLADVKLLAPITVSYTHLTLPTILRV